MAELGPQTSPACQIQGVWAVWYRHQVQHVSWSKLCAQYASQIGLLRVPHVVYILDQPHHAQHASKSNCAQYASTPTLSIM